MVLTQGMINGKLMDMNRVDVSASLGATDSDLVNMAAVAAYDLSA